MGMIAMVQDVLSDLCFEDVAAVAWIFFPVSKYDGTSNGLLKMARVCVCVCMLKIYRKTHTVYLCTKYLFIEQLQLPRLSLLCLS